MMDTFEPYTETYMRQLLKRASNAFYAFDPMTTWFVKECLDVLQNKHWLSVSKRINFKMVLTTYKYINYIAPEYR